MSARNGLIGVNHGRFVRFVALVMMAAALAACGGGSVDSSSKAAVTINIEVQGGSPVGGIQKVTVGRGDAVTVTVSGDSNDRVHIHGYDLYVDLADGSGSTEFDALIPGVFEIELESSSKKLVQLTVS